MFKKLFLIPAMGFFLFSACTKEGADNDAATDNDIIHFVFTSDPHYGLTKNTFRGQSRVNTQTVNQALVAQINKLATRSLPTDGEIGAGTPMKNFEFLIQAGDLANRMERSQNIQSAATSWEQFYNDYYKGLKILDKTGANTPIFLLPGNHDISNAIGFSKPMWPTTDATSMANIYNYMIRPNNPLPLKDYDFDKGKVNYSKDFGGIHFCFVHIWPDSSARVWLEQDLARVGSTMPVVLVTHDPPVIPSAHFTNPNGDHSVNSTDGFDNLVEERFKSGKTTSASSVVEQRGFTAFLKKHPNIRLYLHGHSNYAQFYTWRGPDGDVALPTVRVDSPMKGSVSEKDETKLSFFIASLDPNTKRITFRECLWNTNPQNADEIAWGITRTFDLL